MRKNRSINQIGLAKLAESCFVLPPDLAPEFPPSPIFATSARACSPTMSFCPGLSGRFRQSPDPPMKSELVEKASEIVTDPLVLVNLVSQRVRQLNSGRSPLIPTRPSMGAADIALTEIIEGKIRLVPQVPL